MFKILKFETPFLRFGHTLLVEWNLCSVVLFVCVSHQLAVAHASFYPRITVPARIPFIQVLVIIHYHLKIATSSSVGRPDE